MFQVHQEVTNLSFSWAGTFSYFLAGFWGIYILISVGGWGGLLNRLLFPQQRIDWGQKAAWGLALTIVVGGILNLTWTISPRTIFIYLAFGFSYGVVQLFQDRFVIAHSLNQLRSLKENPIFLAGSIVVLLLLLIRYAGSFHAINAITVNQLDDNHAYLVFPYKMLQMGSLGPDPFSERRLVSVLGGQCFLDSLILSWLPVENINITEKGYSLVLTIAGLIGYLKDRKISFLNSLYVLFLALFIEPPSANITSLIVPVPLLISLFRVLDAPYLKSSSILSNATIIALISAALCSLKGNLLISIILLLVVNYFYYITGSLERHKAICEFILTMGLLGLFLLPWMISLYDSSGTLLYPFLGKGYYGSVYGNKANYYDFDSIWKIIRLFINNSARIMYLDIILGWLYFKERSLWKKNDDRQALPSIIISFILASLIVRIGSSGGFYERYTFSFLFPLLLLLIAIFIDLPLSKKQFTLPKLSSSFAAFVITGIIIASGLNGFLFMYGVSLDSILFRLKQVPLVTEQMALQHQKMQQSIPEGATVLTRLERPFLMNFKRNQVFICDWPGGASPPPGMPIYKGSEPLADYFLSKSIRYIAYSYAKEAGYPRARYVTAGVSPWEITTNKNTFDFQDNLQKLGETRQRIYDDGDIWVIDLQAIRKPKG